MQKFTVFGILFVFFCARYANAQDLIIAHDGAAQVYSDDASTNHTTAPTASARWTDDHLAYPSLDRVTHYADEISPKLRIPTNYDFFQGLQSPHDASTWVYLERQQIGAGYRLVRFDPSTHQYDVLQETDNAQRQELAYKPIAWTDQPDELYVEGLLLDQAEEHEGIWRLSLSTGEMRPVPMPTAYLRTPLLSPDRQKLIVTSTLDHQVDWLHGATDLVYELNLADGARRTIAQQPGSSLEVKGWANQPGNLRQADSQLRTSALAYYLPWDAGVELCVSRHGVPAPTGSHNFVGRCNRFGPGGHHGYAAVDFATSLSGDQNVRAAAAGTVSFAGVSGSLSSGYGRLVILRHSDGTRTYYAHNKSILVSAGQAVERGDVIALEGTTGGSTGDHIHFEWRAAGGSASVKGSFTGIGEPRQDYRYRSNNTQNLDNEAPTTAISAPGGVNPSGNFTVNFADNDNVGVSQRFYQVLERYGDYWYANRGNGFFNDNFKELYAGYTQGEGNWAASDDHLRQTDAASSNTGLTTFLSQASGQPYLYSFAARLISTAGPRKFGVHIMADNPTLSQRGNSYLVWFSAAQNQIIVYKTINNTLYTQTSATVAVDNQWANYKITYNPANGALEVFRNDRSLLKWTDSNPLKTGGYLSLRTNATAVEFDDLKVYKARTGSVSVTAGDAVTNDLRTTPGKIKSLVRDAAGNWSAPGNLDVTRTSAARLAVSSDDELILYPNPTNGKNLTLQYHAKGEQPSRIQVQDVLGRIVGSTQDLPDVEQRREVDLQPLFQNLSTGRYLVRFQQGSRVETQWVNKE